jgi:hypothetical protein
MSSALRCVSASATTRFGNGPCCSSSPCSASPPRPAPHCADGAARPCRLRVLGPTIIDRTCFVGYPERHRTSRVRDGANVAQSGSRLDVGQRRCCRGGGWDAWGDLPPARAPVSHSVTNSARLPLPASQSLRLHSPVCFHIEGVERVAAGHVQAIVLRTAEA